MAKKAFVLDTDIGSDVDDALALALALASPELELVAITTVGNESLHRARIASKFLQLAGRDEIPVHAGCRVPIMGGDGFNWFGHEGEDVLEPTEEPPVSREHAVDALRRLFRERDDLHLCAIGPLTNIAAALILEPDLVGRIQSLTVMGGHIRRAEYGGHVFEPGVDYNLCSDPHASRLVLRAGIPTTLVTADVTLQCWITERELERIEKVGTPFQDTLARSVRLWSPVQKRIFRNAGCNVNDDNVAFLHDPLALACLYDPSLCTFETLEIETEIVDGVLRTVERREAVPLRCATSVSSLRFREGFVGRISEPL
jgi:purine nucleosidase